MKSRDRRYEFFIQVRRTSYHGIVVLWDNRKTISKVIQQILVRGSGVYIWQQEENQSGKVFMDRKCNIYPISDKVEKPQAKVKMDRND
jgi:hypothetical protein